MSDLFRRGSQREGLVFGLREEVLIIGEMIMYRRILVPVDGSTASDVGRAQAIGLAQTEGARLRFLNVLDESLRLSSPDIEAVNMSDLLRSMRELGERSVEEAASLAGKKGLRADTSLLPSRGRRASDVILDEARKWRADLIVMGTHGRRDSTGCFSAAMPSACCATRRYHCCS